MGVSMPAIMPICATRSINSKARWTFARFSRMFRNRGHDACRRLWSLSRILVMSESGRTRIIVADDHPVVTLGVRALLKDRSSMHVVGEAASGGELLAQLATRDCDLLITDFSMPHDEGGPAGALPLLKRLRRDHPDLPIIV